MKRNRSRASELTLCGAVALLLIALLVLWMDSAIRGDVNQVIFLLTALLAAVCAELLLSAVQEIKSEPLAAVRSFCSTCLNLFILANLLVLAVCADIRVLLALMILIPVEVLTHQQLRHILSARSRRVLARTCGSWQELSCSLDINGEQVQGSTVKNYLALVREGNSGARLLLAANVISKAAFAALAVVDPWPWLLFLVLLPLLSAALCKAVFHNLTKADIINSIAFVEELEEKLRQQVSCS